MRVTVLGKSPAYTDAGGACSGYLVEEDGTVVVLDCGNGVFGKLRRFVDYCAVDAVVISHLHADHFLDLVPFSYGLIYAPRQQPVPVDRWPGTKHPSRPTLHAPKGAIEVFKRVTGAWGDEDLILKAFDVREYETRDELDIGPLHVRFHQVPHFLPNTNAVEFSSTATSTRMVYGADHAPTAELVDFARDADLLLIEATLPRPERDGVRGHITPHEAGEHAKRANVKQAVLVHISDELDRLWAEDCASKAFGAPVAVAEEGDVYDLAPAPQVAHDG
ncbi:MAG TPA: MBL fold metallo-hydrolase [Solirubrobacteraceae bacterium]|nr:MBL fold metallo-hydrolase [Solirubrobacteraceae bacterium]